MNDAAFREAEHVMNEAAKAYQTAGGTPLDPVKLAATDPLDEFLAAVKAADPLGALYGEAEFDDLPEIPEGMEPQLDPSGQVGDLHAVAVDGNRAVVWSESAFREGTDPWSIVDCAEHALGLADREEE